MVNKILKDKYSNLSNDELLVKLRENLEENEALFQEILDRGEDGRLKREYDEIDKEIIKRFNGKKL